MKTGLIIPCINQLKAFGEMPTKLEIEDIEKLHNELLNEVEEVEDALKSLHYHRDGKTIAHYGEEVADVATRCITLLMAVGMLEEAPDNFADNTLLWVASKNYSRGYHDRQMV